MNDPTPSATPCAKVIGFDGTIAMSADSPPASAKARAIDQNPRTRIAGTAIRLIHSMALKPMTTVAVISAPPSTISCMTGTPVSRLIG